MIVLGAGIEFPILLKTASICCEQGVRVVSITQQIDLSGPVGRMVASVIFGLAEVELEYRRERQQAGIAAAQEEGIDDSGDCKSTRCDRKDRVPIFDLALGPHKTQRSENQVRRRVKNAPQAA